MLGVVPTLEGGRTYDDRLDWEVGPRQNVADAVGCAAWEVADYEQIDVTALVLLSARKGAEDVDGVDVEIALQYCR